MYGATTRTLRKTLPLINDMNNRDELLIEKYFSRDITPAEQEELQRRMVDDAELADNFRFQQTTAAAIIKNERAQLKAVLQETEKKRTEVTGGWSVWTRYSIAAAAAIALLLFAIPDTRRAILGGEAPLAQEIQFTPYPNKFAMAGAQDAKTTLEKASNAYQAGSFATAAELFGQIDPQQPSYVFYRGVALVGAKEYASAIAVLIPVSQQSDSEYSGPALYYLAEAYWKSNNKAAAKNAAKTYLDLLPKQNNAVFRKNAEGMINQ
jgi:hypothetical protein